MINSLGIPRPCIRYEMISSKLVRYTSPIPYILQKRAKLDWGTYLETYIRDLCLSKRSCRYPYQGLKCEVFFVIYFNISIFWHGLTLLAQMLPPILSSLYAATLERRVLLIGYLFNQQCFICGRTATWKHGNNCCK